MAAAETGFHSQGPYCLSAWAQAACSEKDTGNFFIKVTPISAGTAHAAPPHTHTTPFCHQETGTATPPNPTGPDLELQLLCTHLAVQTLWEHHTLDTQVAAEANTCALSLSFSLPLPLSLSPSKTSIYTQNNSKWIENLNVRPGTVKLIRKHRGNAH
jgi:hypothetical protein